jgi:tRNA (guanine-N7-)-methyltransferase
MAKKKLLHFKENKNFKCLHEPDIKELLSGFHKWRGNWSQNQFNNNNPLTLELGCGRAEYVIEMSKMFPERNFIGIDIKGSRLYHPAREITETNRKNAALVRTKIDFINRIFNSEISEIFITFPDPFFEKPSRRLTSEFFLERYFETLVTNGCITLKTDERVLFDFSLFIARNNNYKILRSTTDLYSEPNLNQIDQIKTIYEQKFLEQGKKICLLKFALDHKPTPIFRARNIG